MNLWESDYFKDTKDITVIVNNKIYLLNSYILLDSEIMREIFEGTRFSEHQNEIQEIYDVSTRTWELFLNLIYSIYIESIEDKTENEMGILKLENLDVEELIELIIFSDKILAYQALKTVSDYVFKNILNNIDDKKNYNLYEYLLTIIDTRVIDFNNINIFHNKIEYDVCSKEWFLNLRQFELYPHLLYYTLVYLSHITNHDSFVSINVKIKCNNIFYDTIIDEKNIHSIMKTAGLRNIYSTIKMKLDEKKSNSTNIITSDTLKYITLSVETLLIHALFNITNKTGDILKTLYDENWRLKQDDIIHSLLVNHFINFSIQQTNESNKIPVNTFTQDDYYYNFEQDYEDYQDYQDYQDY